MFLLSGFYCKLNASSNTPNDNVTGGPCPKGKFCPRGSVEGEDCPNGLFIYTLPQSLPNYYNISHFVCYSGFLVNLAIRPELGSIFMFSPTSLFSNQIQIDQLERKYIGQNINV